MQSGSGVSPLVKVPRPLYIKEFHPARSAVHAYPLTVLQTAEAVLD